MATWRSIRCWAAIACIAVLSLFVLAFTSVSIDDNWHLNVGVGLVTVFVICAAVIRWQVRRHYRCPRFNLVPIRTAYGWGNEFGGEPRDVEWNPEECPNCGTALR